MKLRTKGKVENQGQWVGIIVLSFLAFLALGIPDAMRGVAWPSIQSDFGLHLDSISAVLIAGTIGYVTASLFTSFLLRKTSIAILLALSSSAMAVNQFVSASTGLWLFFVLSSFLGGLGAGIIDAGLNTFVAQNFSSSIMQWMHGFFGVGTTIGPLIMTFSIAVFANWRPGYTIVGIFQILLALLLLLTHPKWRMGSPRKKPLMETQRSGNTIQSEDSQSSTPPENSNPKNATIGMTLRNPRAILSMLMFFLYTGVELGIGTWGFTLLTQSRDFELTSAGFITGSYWAMFTIGRILAGIYTRWLPVHRVILIGLGSAAVGIFCIMLNIADWLTALGFAFTGLAISPIFAALVSDTRKRVGPAQEASTIGLQVAAAGFGGAIMPSLAGLLARNISLEIIPPFTLITIALMIVSFVVSHKANLQRHRA